MEEEFISTRVLSLVPVMTGFKAETLQQKDTVQSNSLTLNIQETENRRKARKEERTDVSISNTHSFHINTHNSPACIWKYALPIYATSEPIELKMNINHDAC